MKKIGLFSTLMLVVFLGLAVPVHAAIYYEDCQVAAFDTRNDHANWVIMKHVELWGFICNFSTSQVIVKACVDNSVKHGNANATTHNETYDTWMTLLNNGLANPSKRYSIWVENGGPTNVEPCMAYWPLIRICTLRNCFSGGYF